MKEPFLSDPVLRDPHGAGRRCNPCRLLKPFEALGWRVLEFGGDHVAFGCQAVERLAVVVRRNEVDVSNRSGWGMRIGIEDECPVAHQLGGHECVPAELTATEHANGCGRNNDVIGHAGGTVEAAA